MSVSGLNCVESCLNCHLRSRSCFCDLSQESIEAFHKIKHAAVFPEHAVVLVEGQSRCGIFIPREGKTLMIRIAERGGIPGLHAVVTGGRYELTVGDHAGPASCITSGATTCCAFSKTTLTPLSMLLSILLETVLMRMVWRARSGCHIRSQRGLPDSCLKRPPMAR